THAAGQGHAAFFISPVVLDVVTLFQPAAIEIIQSEKRTTKEIELLAKVLHLQVTQVQTCFDTMLLRLIIQIAANAKLGAMTVFQRVVVVIDVLEICAQGKQARLHKQMRIARECPMRVDQKVLVIRLKNLIAAEQITIAISIEIEIPEDYAGSDLISF